MKVPGWAVHLWVLALFVMVAACGGGTVVEERVVSVSKAVPTRPIRLDQIPRPIDPLPPRPADPAAATDLLLAKICELYGYMLQAAPLLTLSAGAPPARVEEYPECRATE